MFICLRLAHEILKIRNIKKIGYYKKHFLLNGLGHSRKLNFLFHGLVLKIYKNK